MSGSRLLVGALALLAVCAALFWLLSDDSSSVLPGSVDVPGMAPMGDGVEPVRSGKSAGETAQVEAARAVAEEALPISDGPPPSYLAQLGGITGRVVEPDGTPVPGMFVELLGGSFESIMPPIETLFTSDEPPMFDAHIADDVTDDEGCFRFNGLQILAVHLLGVDLGGARAKVQFIDRAPVAGEIADIGDVVLEPYVTFTGRVVDERSTPVPDARVRATNLPSIIFSFGAHLVGDGTVVAFEDPSSNKWRAIPIVPSVTRLLERFPIPETSTDADGNFRLEGVPLGLATVVVQKQQTVPLVHGPVPTGAGGERDLGTLRLLDVEQLTGIVLDEADQPVPGVEIFAGPQLDIFPAGFLRSLGVSGDDGRFNAIGFDDSEHIVAARLRPGSNWVFASDQIPGYDDVELRLSEGTSLTIIARNELGEILNNAQVVIQPIERMPLHPLVVPPIPLANRMRVRDDGAVIVTGLDKRKYSVMAKADGYAVAQGEASLTDGPDAIDLILEKELSAQVTVVAAGNGAPVEWAMVSAHDNGQEQRELKMLPLLTRRTDGVGNALLAGLKKGSYLLLVNHPGYAVSSAEVEVPGELVAIELQQGGELRGRIHGNGRPPDEPRFVGMGVRRGNSFPRFTVTDENGEFSVTHLQPESYRLVIMRRFATKPMGAFVSEGFETMEVERHAEASIAEGEVTWLDVDLLGDLGDGPTANLRGRVALHGGPGASMLIAARPKGGWRSRRSAMTDDFGGFDLGQVPVGKVTVSVRHPGTEGGSGNFFRRDDIATQEIELVEGVPGEANFNIRTGGLRGTVVVEGTGAPVLAARVRLDRVPDGDEPEDKNDGGRVRTVTDKQGQFVVDLLPAGRYEVSARRDGFATTVVDDVRVPFNSFATPVTIRLVQGVAMAGTVQLPAGVQPGRWLWLEFRDAEDRRVGGARVDVESMQYEASGLMPGEHRVRVYSAEQEFDEVTVTVPAGGSAGVVLSPVLKEAEKSQ